jgi:lanthanide-dependent methanol dehydrogenase
VIKDVGGKTMMFIGGKPISGCPEMSKCNIVQALDLTDPDNPKQIWNYVKKTDRDESAVPRACCDTVNRGGSYADGKVVLWHARRFRDRARCATGKEVWVVKHAYPEKGETITPAPLIAENLVIGASAATSSPLAAASPPTT